MNILKKLCLLALAIAGIFGSVDAAKKKVLMAYFSYTENTEKIVKKVAQELTDCDVDLKKIEPVEKYTDDRDKLRDQAKEEAENDNFRPKLKDGNFDVSPYDLVIVGTPTWWYKAPKVVIAFLEKQKLTGKKVCLLITHGGGSGTCQEDIKTACKGAKFGSFVEVYCDFSVNEKVDNEEVKNWIKQLKEEVK